MKQASNSFTGGLVLDMHPLTTQNTQLTDALNATLITFNGNEMMLQNDMGNTKIQDTKTGNLMGLRNGFIPVGMTEHGGVMYIASVNKEGLGEIGTIPSPIIRYDNEENYINLQETVLNASPNMPSDLYKLTHEKLSVGDKFAVIMQLEDDQEIQVPTLSQGSIINLNYPMYSNLKQKGLYKINLWAQTDDQVFNINNTVETTADSYLYCVKETDVESIDTSKVYWFANTINQKKASEISFDINYMKIADASDTLDATSAFIKYPNVPKGYPSVNIETEQIDDFYLSENAARNQIYPLTYVDSDLNFWAIFPYFVYKTNSAVHVHKMEIRVEEEGGIKQQLEDVSSGISNTTLVYDVNDLVNPISREQDAEQSIFVLYNPSAESYINVNNKTNPLFADTAYDKALFRMKIGQTLDKWYTLYVTYYDNNWPEPLGVYSLRFNQQVMDVDGMFFVCGTETADLTNQYYRFDSRNEEDQTREEKYESFNVLYKVTTGHIKHEEIMQNEDEVYDYLGGVTTITWDNGSGSGLSGHQVNDNMRYLYKSLPNMPSQIKLTNVNVTAKTQEGADVTKDVDYEGNHAISPNKIQIFNNYSNRNTLQTAAEWFRARVANWDGNGWSAPPNIPNASLQNSITYTEMGATVTLTFNIYPVTQNNKTLYKSNNDPFTITVSNSKLYTFKQGNEHVIVKDQEFKNGNISFDFVNGAFEIYIRQIYFKSIISDLFNQLTMELMVPANTYTEADLMINSYMLVLDKVSLSGSMFTSGGSGGASGYFININDKNDIVSGYGMKLYSNENIEAGMVYGAFGQQLNEGFNENNLSYTNLGCSMGGPNHDIFTVYIEATYSYADADGYSLDNSTFTWSNISDYMLYPTITLVGEDKLSTFGKHACGISSINNIGLLTYSNIRTPYLNDSIENGLKFLNNSSDLFSPSNINKKSSYMDINSTFKKFEQGEFNFGNDGVYLKEGTYYLCASVAWGENIDNLYIEDCDITSSLCYIQFTITDGTKTIEPRLGSGVSVPADSSNYWYNKSSKEGVLLHIPIGGATITNIKISNHEQCFVEEIGLYEIIEGLNNDQDTRINQALMDEQNGLFFKYNHFVESDNKYGFYYVVPQLCWKYYENYIKNNTLCKDQHYDSYCFSGSPLSLYGTIVHDSNNEDSNGVFTYTIRMPHNNQKVNQTYRYYIEPQN